MLYCTGDERASEVSLLDSSVVVVGSTNIESLFPLQKCWCNNSADFERIGRNGSCMMIRCKRFIKLCILTVIGAGNRTIEKGTRIAREPSGGKCEN